MPLKGAILSLILVACLLTVSTGPATEKAEAVVPLIVIGAVVVGAFVAGWIANDLLTGGGEGSDAAARSAWYATELKNSTERQLSMANASAYNSQEIMKKTDMRYARQAQWAALELYNYQTANNLTHTYDANWVMNRSGIFSDLQDIYIRIGVVANSETVFTGLDNVATSFVGDYAEMSYAIQTYNNGDWYSGTAIASQTGLSYLHVSPMYTLETGGYYHINASEAVWLVNAESNANDPYAKIYNSTGGLVWNSTGSLAGGEIDQIVLADLGLPSGTYRFNVSNDVHWWSYAPMPALVDGGAIYPGYVAYTLVSGEPSARQTSYRTEPGTWFTIKYATTPSGGSQPRIAFSGGGATETVEFTDIINDLGVSMSVAKTIMTTANNYGQTYYNVVVANGGGGDMPYPDMIFPDWDQLENLTPEGLTAAYLAYMTAQQEWYKTHAYLTADNITISASMDLMVRGSIYDNNGTLLKGNTTIFTPYTMLDDVTFHIGVNNLTQPGFLVSWGSAPSMAAWESNATGSSRATEYIQFSSGYQFVIEEIFYKGEAKDSVTLTVNTLDQIVSEVGGTPTTPPAGDAANWLTDNWYWLCIGLGAAILIAAVYFRNTPLAAIGGIILLVGIGGYVLIVMMPDWLDGLKLW